MSTALVKPKAGVTELSMTPEQFIKAAVASELYKDTKSLAQAYIKLTLGASLGIDPATAMSSILLVNGKPSFTANLIAARIKQSGKYRYEIVEKTDKKCSIQFYEQIEDYTPDGKQIKKWIKPGPAETFSVDMAKAAGLTKNPVWSSFPMNMCYCRALTNGAKTYCPDVMVGNQIYTPDELDPNMKMQVTQDGDVVPEAEWTSAPTPTVTQKGVRTEEIEKLIVQTGADRKGLLAYCKVTSLDQLTPEAEEKVIQMLKAKEQATP